MAAEFAIELKNITKMFGSVAANKNVNLSLKQGEILALLGENGSGKTTLMNMLSGIYRPDGGDIYVNGEKVEITSPEDAKRLGIGMVHQHFKLVEAFSAADNIWLGRENRRYGWRAHAAARAAGKKGIGKLWAMAAESGRAIGFFASERLLRKSRYSEIEHISRDFGFEIDSGKKVYNMAVSEKQTLEIIKVLYYGAKVIILDEPTAGLDPKGREYILSEIKAYHEKRGATVILVSHSMEDVARFASHVLIMNRSKVAMYGKTREVFARVEELVEMGLEVPQISRVFAKLAADGVSVPESVLTVAEAKSAVLGLLGKGGEC